LRGHIPLFLRGENMDILAQVKVLTGKTNDGLILLLIEKAKAEVVIYCKTDYVSAMDNLIADIVIYKLNTLGTDGISGQSYNGVSESYTDKYPLNIRMQLDSFRKRVYFL
jgi:hypothetical protein